MLQPIATAPPENAPVYRPPTTTARKDAAVTGCSSGLGRKRGCTCSYKPSGLTAFTDAGGREAAKRAGQGNDRLSDERSGHRLSRLSAEPGGAAALSRGDEMNVVQGKRVRGRKGPAMSRNQVRRQQDVGGQAGMDNLRNILIEMGIEVLSVLHRVCVVCADVRAGAQVGAGMRLRTVPT